MMHRRIFFTILAATVFVAALGGATDRASGAIRVTISDGSTTQVFYDPDNRGLFETSIGDYDVLLQTTLTNYPGSEVGTFLNQTINIEDNSDPGLGLLPTLTVTAEVIDPVAGVSAGLVGAGDLAAVTGADLALFTAPTGPVLEIRSNVAPSDILGIATTGVTQNITTVDGIALASLPNPVKPTIEAETTMYIANPDNEFTLTSTVTLTGANEGIALTIAATSGVFGTPFEQVPVIPEPGSVAVWGLGALGLAWASRRRFATAAKG